MEFDIGNVVMRSIITRARHQTGFTFNAHNSTCLAGEGKRKISQTTKKIQHTIFFFWIQ